MDSHPDLWEGPPFTASYKMAATHHLKGVIAILAGIHKISNYKSEKPDHEKQLKKTLEIGMHGYIHVNEWLLLLIKNNKNKSTRVLKEGKAQLAHFATAPGVYLIHQTSSTAT